MHWWVMASMARPSESRRFEARACGTTFSSRRNTPLYRLKTPSQQIAMVLSVLAEGLDASAAERVFGYRQATITRLSHSRWATRTDLARTLLRPSLDSPSPTGRTAHQAAEFEAWCYGYGWLLILARRFFPCSSSAPEHNTWRINSSTLSESSWLPAVSRSSPVMA